MSIEDNELPSCWRPNPELISDSLAHNDFAERSQLDAHQLWVNLSANDLVTARELATRLWSLYSQGNLALRGRDVVEPAHASLQNRPAMILRHLCASRYLDNEIKTLEATGDSAQRAEKLHKLRSFEIAHMGEDRQHPLFHS